MIVVSEGHEKQDTYTGPTIRLPERVARRRRSLSPLPDYEASQAQYRRSLVLDHKNKQAWHQSKIWRAILFLLLTYAILTTVIGVPIVVKKMKQQNEDPWNGDGFMGSTQFSSSAGVITYKDNMPCNTWTNMDYVHSLRPYRATFQLQLPVMGEISIRSNATLENTLPDNVIGTLTAEFDSSIKDNSAQITLTMQTTTRTLQESTLVCYDDIGPDRGLSIFFPSNITAMDSISMDIHVAFPRVASFQTFNVYLPVFTQVFKDLTQVDIESVNIEGTIRPINVTNLRAPCISVKSVVGDIIGTFNASGSLLLDTIRGDINASITLVKASPHSSPTSMSLDTGDRNINAQVTLLTPGRFSSSPQFVGKINNFNADINLAVRSDPSSPPVPIYFTVQNNLQQTRVMVEGNENHKYDDIFGSSKQRTLLFDQPRSSSRSSGWVGWGNKPDPSVGQSRVEITSSLGPVELQFGPT
ncbi:hypothetical protein AN958_03122 [Leucoagaricus sp. SymC.cos]|nr:hypothetical protein AN958_03122 [Leucoagaricus sp. SymC.cos]